MEASVKKSKMEDFESYIQYGGKEEMRLNGNYFEENGDIEIIKLLVTKHGFNEERVKSKLAKLQHSKVEQKGLNSFF